jgi:hypothetical protein
MQQQMFCMLIKFVQVPCLKLLLLRDKIFFVGFGTRADVDFVDVL